MSYTLASIVALVNSETGNTVDRGGATAEGDGESTEFFICPPFRSLLDTADFMCWVDGVGDTAGSIDVASGVYSFVTAPGFGSIITWQFDYVYWSNALVEAAVQAGIDNIFPFFYNPTVETMAGTVENTFTTAGAEVVTMIVTTGTSVTKVKRDKYTTYKSGNSLVLRWYGAAPSGTLRAHLICRPALVSTLLNVADRAVAPIVSYAIYYLMGQQQAPRLRSDSAMALVGQGNLSPRQMNDASNSFFLRYQAQCAQSRQLPWSIN